MGFGMRRNVLKFMKGHPVRIMGVALLAMVMAVSCTGNGCQGCTSCKSCGEEKPPEPGISDKGPGTTGPGAQPGQTVPGETVKGPKPPGQLDSDTVKPDVPPGTESKKKERLRSIVEQGEGTNRPATPTGFSATVVRSNFVELSWRDASDNEISFQVDKAGEDGIFSAIKRVAANTDEATDGPLDPGSYSYRVRAVSETGASPFVGPARVTISTAQQPPAAPSNLSASPDPSGEILLNWNSNSTNVGYFRMERAGGEQSWTGLGTLNPEMTAYRDMNSESGVEYSYRVFAGNDAGESGPSNVATAMVEADDEKPEAPSNLQGSVAGPNSVVLDWQDNSDNEDMFIIQKFDPTANRYLTVKEVDRDNRKAMMGNISRGETGEYRVKAANQAGESDPSNSVTVTTQGEALHTYMMEIGPGQMTVEIPSDSMLPRIEVENVRQDGGDLIADVTVHNPDPGVQLENVYVLAAESDAAGLVFRNCDRGVATCSVDQGVESDDPVGYQYVEGGYLGKAPMGGKLQTFDLRNRQRQIAVRDIWPACGQVETEWRIGGVTGPATVALNLYATQSPADFTMDSRYDNDLPMFIIETYSVGVEDGLHEAGSRENPTARPINSLSPGDVFAVNVSVEAGDWMENQAEIGKIELEPNAHYVYWTTLAYVLTYDPEVIRPIESPVITDEGARLMSGVRDPMEQKYAADDGWSQQGSFNFTAWFAEEGWIQSIYSYPAFQTKQEGGETKCVHCFQEGFLDEDGRLQGPDPEPEAFLSVIYFQVVGEPGNGSPLRLFPKPETLIAPMKTNGTITDYKDDTNYTDWKEMNKLLPPTYQLPGDYQVQEAYICVE